MELPCENNHKLFTRKDFSEHARRTLILMWNDAKKGVFCDVILIAGLDKKKIAAHRSVLSAVNDFFRTMFHSEFKEAEEKEVMLADISSDILESLIQYCYTGTIKINEDNAHLLLPQASLMMFQEIVEACSDFHVSSINPSNCLSMVQYAKLYNCQSLQTCAEEYSKEHFINVVVQQEFLNLNEEKVEEYLSYDELGINSEKDVFEAMMRWINHDPNTRNASLCKLLRTIRLHFIESNYLLEYVLKNRKEQYHCVLMDGIDEILHKTQAKPERSGLKPNRIVFVYDQTIKIYNPKMNIVEVEYSFKKCNYFQAALIENMVMVVGENNVQYIDLSTGISRDLILPQTKRSLHSIAVIKEFVYVVGGHPDNNLVERWDIKENKWSYLACMKQPRHSHCTATLNRKLYAIGGCANNTRLNSVECYDPNTNEWTFCKPMLKNRSSARAVVVNGEIYVFGGLSDTEVLNCIEKYTPGTDTWTMVSEMTSKRYIMGACLFNQKVLLYGGWDGNKWLTSMEEYDPLTNECKLYSEHLSFDFVQSYSNLYLFANHSMM